MLKFVTGSAGTGKSKYITDMIVQKAKSGEKCLLIVPEQFSKTGENLIFSNLDNTRARLVQVFSFTSLLADVQSNYTKLAKSPLTAAGKAVMARRAMKNSEKMMNLYTRQANNFNFSYILTGTFDDLKRSGYSSDDFYKLVQDKATENYRLEELALLYSEYTGLMGDKFCDHEDLLVALSENLPQEYVEDANIFIDGFESFSFGQKKIIGKMLESAKDMYIALVCDGLVDITAGTGYFSFVQACARDLLKSLEIKKYDEINLCEKHRFLNTELKNIDSFLQGDDVEKCENNHAFIHTADTQAQEVAYALAQIYKLVQTENYSYSDIAIVCPQLEKYENQLQESLQLAKMPYFIDSNRIISSSAPVIFFADVLNIMTEGLDSENIISLLKTGLTKFDDEDIQVLENYLYTWQEYDFDLSQAFAFSAKGLKAQPDDDETEIIARIDGIRKEVYECFKKHSIDSKNALAGDILTNCYLIAQELGAEEKAELLTSSFENEDAKALFLRQWEAAVDCLNELYTIMSDDVVNNADLRQLYNLIVSGVQIGFAPETQDCIMISQPKRMRLDSVKAVFILGAAEDHFPAAASEAGLISSADRENLNIKLNSDFDSQYSFENLYFYKALTTAREYLFISCAKKNIDLKQNFSRQIEAIKEADLLKENNLDTEDYAITKEFFADFISTQANNVNRKAYTQLLNDIDVETHDIADRVYTLSDTAFLQDILGPELSLAPSRAERFFSCPFLYFLESVMKIKPVEKAEFSNRIAGNYLHFVAQRVIGRYGEEFYAAAWDEIKRQINQSVDDFLREYYPQQIVDNPVFTAQFENMKLNATHLLEHIYNEQQNSKFRPIAFEQNVARDGLTPLVLTTENGNKINITGICDRVDVYRGESTDYLRIVDYKTGTKDFKLDDVYNGTALQLLVYMDALLKNQFGKKENELTAGAVLYQNSDVAPKFDDDGEKLYHAAGMAKAESDISSAFDTSFMGRFGVIRGSDKIDKADKHSEVVDSKVFEEILEFAKTKVVQMGDEMYRGDFDAMPLAEKEGQAGKACQYCQYKSVCMNNSRSKRKEKNNFKTKK